MSHVSLSVSTRTEFGSAVSRRRRREGLLPGVLYQPGSASLAFTADEAEVRRLVRGGGIRSAVVDLIIDSDAPRTVLFKAWSSDPVRDQITHIDLQQVDLTIEVEADVPVILVGSPAGVRDGGILDQTSLTVRVRALPDALPRSIEYDISDLAVGEAVHVSDIVAPTGSTMVTDSENAIASIMLSRAGLSDGTEEGAEGVEGISGAEGESTPGADAGSGEE